MERLSLLLLLATAIAAIQICSTLAQNGRDGNDTSEKFSGSGTPGDSSCYIPANSNLNHGRMNLTEEELEDVMMEGCCYLACTADEDYMSRVTTKHNTTMFYWPYSVVEEGCATTQKIHECVRGCVTRFGVSRRRCSTSCFNKCSVECNGTHTGCTNPDTNDAWIHPQCTVDCETRACSVGCNLKLDESDTESLPWDPVRSPAVNPISSAAWQFTIDLSQASPTPSSGNSSISVAPVAFLLRIELTSSQTFSFKWAAEPFMQLDLADYACQEIRISFAVTNRIGLSQFSDPVHIIVDGVHPPRNLQVLSAIDTRIGFFGYATLNISWEPPQNDVYLEYYSITISSNTVTCTREWSQSLISNDTFIVVMGTMGTPFPQTNCIYKIQVSSVGQAGNSEPISEMHHTPESAVDPKNIGFQCKRLWNSQEYFFSFNFTWALPDYLRYGGIIEHFQIKYGMTGIGKKLKKNIALPQNSPAVFSEVISPNDTGIDGRPYNTPRPISSMGVAFLFEMNVAWMTALSPAPAPYTYNCTASTLSPAPTIIENIIMESYCFSSDTQVTLSFHWKPPSNFNGEPSNYTACLGTHPLNPTEDTPEGHFCTSHSLLPELSNATVTLLYARISSHIYFQMRASNEFVSGNWSEAYEIPLSSMGTGCASTTSASTSSTNSATVGIIVGSTSTSYTSGATVGIIVGSTLGGVALIILLTCCTCVTVWYVKMLRQRKKLRRITEKEEHSHESGRPLSLPGIEIKITSEKN